MRIKASWCDLLNFGDQISKSYQSHEIFEKYTKMGSKEEKGKNPRSIFDIFSNGIKSRRDAWVYNISEKELEHNMKNMIDYCNTQDPDNFINDPINASWTPHLSKEIKRHGKPIMFSKTKIRTALFRPFIKHFLYFDRVFVSDLALIPSYIFPSSTFRNPTITVPDKIKGTFSIYMTDITPDLHIHESSQCFPLKTKKNIDKNVSGISPSRTSTQIPVPKYQYPNTIDNPTIIVPDKIPGKFSVFITNMIPDLEVVHHGQCFPMKVMT